MAFKASDLILSDVWEVALFDIQTGKPLALLKNCNSTELVFSSTTTKITGGRGAKVLAVRSGEEDLVLNVESATFDLNLLRLQAGDKDGLYKTSASVPVFEQFTIPSASSYTVTLKYTPSEDEMVTVLLDDGTPLIEGETAGVGEFSLAGNVLTFDASCAGKTGTVFYEKISGESIEININTGTGIQKVTVKAFGMWQNTCDGLNYVGYLIIPMAAVDKNFTIAASKGSDGEAVHNVVFNALSTCGDSELAKIVIYDQNEE